MSEGGGSGGHREEIPHTLKPEARDGVEGATTPPCPRSGVAAGRSNPMPKARVSGQEDQPHSVAALAQEVLEELSHIEGQEGRW